MAMYEEENMEAKEDSFDSIYRDLMEKFDQNPDQDIDAFLQRELEKLGISSEGKRMFEEASELIDDFSKNLGDLKNSRGKGDTREQWVSERIDKSLAGRSDEEKQEYVNALDEVTSQLDNQYKEVEQSVDSDARAVVDDDVTIIR